MFFSLELLEEVFGETSPEMIEQVKSDLKKIRKVQRRERGFFKSLLITNNKILLAFSVYNSYSDYYLFFKTVFDEWEGFVKLCTGENAPKQLDWYI